MAKVDADQKRSNITVREIFNLIYKYEEYDKYVYQMPDTATVSC